jgi:serine/threonine-protein kinase
MTLDTRIGPYEVLSSIGSGGMGEVWKARDTRLDRIVAIKRLKAPHSGRFEQEARTIAALNHPHICQIYDVGPDYLVMEYVDGRPLSGPLPVERAIDLALQIAAALEEAHGRGILHRDLKPANILVTSKGTAKLLDFGLAKILAPTSDATVTADGTVLGTAAYMSPEQAQGRPLDERSDVFSFGAVLYELLSGRPTFKRTSTLDTLNAVVRDEPAPLSSPVADIVTKCLAKMPAERYQSMAEVRAILLTRARKESEAAHAPSIAVLPFVNMSRDPDDEYFSDGLAEEILNLLAHIPELKVTARTSSFAFRGKEQDITAIAAALKVRTILEGSVRRAGSRIRVTAQLINAADGYHLWSERYDRELTDVFAVQDEIAAAIANALHLKLTPASSAVRRYHPNPAAYEAFLRGRHTLLKGVAPVTLHRAKEYLEQASTLDPQYAEPHSEIGMYYFLLGASGVRPPADVMPLARTSAIKARDLNPYDPCAHAVLGLVAATYDFDWVSAEDHFQRARGSGPLAPEVRMRCALIRTPRGSLYDRIRELETALEQDPLSVATRAVFAMLLSWSGQLERAVAEARKASEMDASQPFALLVLAECCAAHGLIGEAREAAEKSFRLAPQPRTAGVLAETLVRAGATKPLDELLPGWAGDPSVQFRYHIARGDIDAAADAYGLAIDQRSPIAVMLAASPPVKPLRDSDRWPAIARKMNLT